MVKQMTAVGEKLASKQSSRDTFSIFGEFVGSELRKFANKKYAKILAEAKYKITSALHDAELEMIELESNQIEQRVSITDEESTSILSQKTPMYITLDSSNSQLQNAQNTAGFFSEFDGNM